MPWKKISYTWTKQSCEQFGLTTSPEEAEHALFSDKQNKKNLRLRRASTLSLGDRRRREAQALMLAHQSTFLAVLDGHLSS